MKKIFLLVMLFILIPSILATNLEITKKSSDEVMIIGIDKPVAFDLSIKNFESSDYFEFYNFLGFDMFPKGTVYIGQGGPTNIELKLSPLGEVKARGRYIFKYYIKGQNSPETEKELSFDIIELKDAFKIGAEDMNPESNSITIYITNKENFNFENVKTTFSSPFFEIEKEFSLAPYEKKIFEVNLNREDFKELTAGYYTLEADVDAYGETANIQGTIKFSEQDNVVTTQEDSGLIVHTQILKKVNEGNVVTTSETIFKKNIVSRLFTTISPNPDIVDRQGSTVYYTWDREIKPGETLEIIVKTNWMFPLAIILLLIAVVILVKKYTTTDVILSKKVNFVKTKGGEFALKVTVFVKAKSYVERVSVVDRLPSIVKLHEKFGAEQPTRVNEKARVIEWNFQRLNAGESRVLSYIIYSKIGILGKFALPSATAIFEKEGKIKEANSNQAFFVAEQQFRRKEEDGY